MRPTRSWRLGLATGILAVVACGPAAVASPTAEPVSAPTVSPSAVEPSPAPATETSHPGGPVVFHLVPEETVARFTIDEVLRGSPNTVVGATSEVSGDIQLDLSAPDQAVVAPIHIQAGSLATDSSLRDRAIRTFILQTSSFPEVVFTATSVDGLPAHPAVGEPFTFMITGDLTIRDLTRTETFTVNVTPESETRLSGTASATIARADYGLTIPSVPSVANVSETLLLELEFTATA
jgi:polyisoprenoid-binding protein YceI